MKRRSRPARRTNPRSFTAGFTPPWPRPASRRPQSRGRLVLLLLLLVLMFLLVPRPRLDWWRRPAAGPGRVTAAVPPASASSRSLRRGVPEVRARVYFLRIVNGKERMVPVTRLVPVDAPAKGVLRELLAGQVPEGCARPLPAGVSVRRVWAKHGVVTVDFSRELVSGFRGGSDSEGVAVYAVVNTLTSLPGVKKAQLLVEGARLDSLGGHLDISTPLTQDTELVVPTPN